MNEMSWMIKFISIWKLNITIFPAAGLTQLRSPAGLPALPAGFHVSTAETPVLVSLWEHTLTLSLKIRNPAFQLEGLQATRSLGLTASLVSKYWWVRCIPRSVDMQDGGVLGNFQKASSEKRKHALLPPFPCFTPSGTGLRPAAVTTGNCWLRDTPLGRLNSAQERPWFWWPWGQNSCLGRPTPTILYMRNKQSFHYI